MPYDELKYNMIFAKNLNNYLAAYEMSQAQLAKRLNISTASISYWCKGQKSPRMDKVDMMCKIFNCTRSDLMDEHALSAPTPPSAPEDKDVLEHMEHYKKLDKLDRLTVDSLTDRLLTDDKYKKDTELYAG